MLARGSLDNEDMAFDEVYPPAIRRLSRHFWTPLAVARRACELFRLAAARRVLDVGAGVGKFVLAAAEAAPECEFVGVEHRAHLVGIARNAQTRLGIANARFVVGDAPTTPWTGFEGIYLFNPLAENLFAQGNRIDDSVELNQERFVRDALRVETALAAMPLGTTIVTYHGSGTRIPACYELETCEKNGSECLRCWVKRRESVGRAYFIENDDGAVLSAVVASQAPDSWPELPFTD